MYQLPTQKSIESTMKKLSLIFLSLVSVACCITVPFTLDLHHTNNRVLQVEHQRHFGNARELQAVVLQFTFHEQDVLCYMDKKTSVYTERALERMHAEQPPVTYESDNCVFTFLNETFFDGIAVVDHVAHHFHRSGSNPDKLHIDDAKGEDGRCKVDHSEHGRDLDESKPDLWGDCYPKIASGYKLNIGIAVGNRFQKTFGKSTVAQVQSMVSSANFAFRNQLNIELAVDHLYMDAGPWDEFCSIGIDKQFQAFTRWKKPSNQGLWHIIDNCLGLSGERWSGTAYRNAICRRAVNTGITYCSGRQCSRGYKTLAHEIGHNFGAGHSFEEGVRRTGGIMDYGNGFLDGLFQFNRKYRSTEICTALRNVIPRCDAFSPMRKGGKKTKKTKYPTTFPSSRIETPYPSPFPTRE